MKMGVLALLLGENKESKYSEAMVMNDHQNICLQMTSTGD